MDFMTETKPTMYKQLTNMLELFIRAEWEAEYGYSPCNPDDEFDIWDRMNAVLEVIPQGKLSITTIVEELTGRGYLKADEKHHLVTKLYQAWKESGMECWSSAWLQDLLSDYRQTQDELYAHAVEQCGVAICKEPDSTHVDSSTFGDYTIYLCNMSAQHCLDTLGSKASIESITNFYQ